MIAGNGSGYEMKDFKFDINAFLSCCEQYGIEGREGSGKILIDDAEVNVSDIIEEKLAAARSMMDSSPRITINGATCFSFYTERPDSTVTFAA